MKERVQMCIYIHICIQVKQTYSLHTYHSCTNENLYKRVFIYVIIYIYINVGMRRTAVGYYYTRHGRIMP